MSHAMEMLNGSLDKLLSNAPLNAKIPYTYEGSGQLTWVDIYDTLNRNPKQIRTNTDLEEQFHLM